jgi:hypothetical protein
VPIHSGMANGLKDPDSYEVAYRLWAFPYLRKVDPVDKALKKD